MPGPHPADADARSAGNRTLIQRKGLSESIQPRIDERPPSSQPPGYGLAGHHRLDHRFGVEPPARIPGHRRRSGHLQPQAPRPLQIKRSGPRRCLRVAIVQRGRSVGALMAPFEPASAVSARIAGPSSGRRPGRRDRFRTGGRGRRTRPSGPGSPRDLGERDMVPPVQRFDAVAGDGPLPAPPVDRFARSWLIARSSGGQIGKFDGRRRYRPRSRQSRMPAACRTSPWRRRPAATSERAATTTRFWRARCVVSAAVRYELAEGDEIGAHRGPP